MTDEYFKRSDAIETLMQLCWHDEDGYPVEDADEKRQYAEDWVNAIPSADVAEVVHAYWHDIYQFGEDYWHIPDNVGTCSHCGNSSHFNVPLGTKYCPDCGAIMDFHERGDVKE